jgi:hypothetical protein
MRVSSEEHIAGTHTHTARYPLLTLLTQQLSHLAPTTLSTLRVRCVDNLYILPVCETWALLCRKTHMTQYTSRRRSEYGVTYLLVPIPVTNLSCHSICSCLRRPAPRPSGIAGSCLDRDLPSAANGQQRRGARYGVSKGSLQSHSSSAFSSSSLSSSSSSSWSSSSSLSSSS